MIFKPSVKTEREKAQNEIDDAIEAISVFDNAIACGFLKDKHSLIAQEWIKEYKNDIENVCKRSTNFISKCLDKSFLNLILLALGDNQ